MNQSFSKLFKHILLSSCAVFYMNSALSMEETSQSLAQLINDGLLTAARTTIEMWQQPYTDNQVKQLQEAFVAAVVRNNLELAKLISNTGTTNPAIGMWRQPYTDGQVKQLQEAFVSAAATNNLELLKLIANTGTINPANSTEALHLIAALELSKSNTDKLVRAKKVLKSWAKNSLPSPFNKSEIDQLLACIMTEELSEGKKSDDLAERILLLSTIPASSQQSLIDEIRDMYLIEDLASLQSNDIPHLCRVIQAWGNRQALSTKQYDQLKQLLEKAIEESTISIIHTILQNHPQLALFSPALKLSFEKLMQNETLNPATIDAVVAQMIDMLGLPLRDAKRLILYRLFAKKLSNKFLYDILKAVAHDDGDDIDDKFITSVLNSARLRDNPIAFFEYAKKRANEENDQTVRAVLIGLQPNAEENEPIRSFTFADLLFINRDHYANIIALLSRADAALGQVSRNPFYAFFI